MSYTYEYARPALTVDCVIFGFAEQALQVLLIRRGLEPYKDGYALPGGFVQMDESLDQAAMRELREETGVQDVYLEQLQTFGNPDRDPRGRVVSVAYYALVKPEAFELKADTDAADAAWHHMNALPQLAFDHAEILQLALDRLREKIRREPLGFELLPENFTLPELQQLYEAVLGKPLDKRNFRKKVASFGLLTPLDAFNRSTGRRPAQLYRFDCARYEALKTQGFLFEL